MEAEIDRIIATETAAAEAMEAVEVAAHLHIS